MPALIYALNIDGVPVLAGLAAVAAGLIVGVAIAYGSQALYRQPAGDRPAARVNTRSR